MALSHRGIPKNAAIRAGYSHYKSIRRRIEVANTPGLIQIPNWYFPHSGYTGALWIEMQPRKLSQINTGGRGGTFKTTDEGPVYRFLAPIDGINETHNHDWAVYESMQLKLQKMISAVETGIQQTRAVGASLYSSVMGQLEKGELPNASDVKNAMLRAGSLDKPKKKFDAPLAYENSGRRQFLFTFPLLSEGLKTDLIQIVKDIQVHAAPAQAGGVYEIEWPSVWSIQSEPKGVLDVDIAACTSVQANWLDPYISGVPQRCDLTLGFTDISPLFADTIIYGSLIRISEQLKEKQTKTYTDHLKDKGNISKEVKSAVEKARETLGYPKVNTPINP